MKKTQLSQNRNNPNFHEHEETLYFHFFGILEVPKPVIKKYFIGGPLRKLRSNLSNGLQKISNMRNLMLKSFIFGLQII